MLEMYQLNLLLTRDICSQRCIGELLVHVHASFTVAVSFITLPFMLSMYLTT